MGLNEVVSGRGEDSKQRHADGGRTTRELPGRRQVSKKLTEGPRSARWIPMDENCPGLVDDHQ